MAELVGRTISATEGGSSNIPPSRSNNPRQASFNTRAGQTTIATDDIGHDVSRLYNLVETAMMNMPTPDTTKNNGELRPTDIVRQKEMLVNTWNSIREWLESHPSSNDRQLAAQHTGQFLTTTLHMLCKLLDPPVDIIQSLIDCAPETVEWQDSNGWLPLHHACANGASGKVLSVLVTAYPEGKVQQDKRFRTPLHFAFFRRDAHDDKMGKNSSITDPSNGGIGTDGGAGTDGDDKEVGNSMPEIVRLLSDSGAAELQDEGGMVSVCLLFFELSCSLRVYIDMCPTFAHISHPPSSLHIIHTHTHVHLFSYQCTMQVPTEQPWRY